LACTARIHRRHAAADHHHARPTGTVDLSLGLADVGNEVHRIAQAFGLASATPSAFTPPRPMPRNTAS
jgi:hypothetical protein